MRSLAPGLGGKLLDEVNGRLITAMVKDTPLRE